MDRAQHAGNLYPDENPLKAHALGEPARDSQVAKEALVSLDDAVILTLEQAT